MNFSEKTPPSEGETTALGEKSGEKPEGAEGETTALGEKSGEKPGEIPEVHLGPLLGLKPAVYLPFVLGGIFLLILLALFLLPAFLSPEVTVDILTLPAGGSVTINGRLYGPTPLRAYLKPGIYKVKIKKESFPPLAFELEVKSRIWGTLFLTDKMKVVKKFGNPDYGTLTTRRMQEYSRLGMTDRFDEGFFLPPILSNTIIEGSFPYTRQNEKKAEAFLENARLFVDSKEELADWIYSRALASSRGKILSASSLSSILSGIIELKEKHGLTPLWISEILKKETSRANSIFHETPWFKKYRSRLSTSPAPKPKERADRGIIIGGIPFYGIPQTELKQPTREKSFGPRDAVMTETAGPFYVSEREITFREYQRFLKEEPFWDYGNLETLIKTGRVNEDYMGGRGRRGNTTASFISYEAAAAFCRWFARGIEGPYSQLTVRLPASKELEALNIHFPGTFSPDRWLWCEDWYFPGALFFQRDLEKNRISEQYIASEKVLLGKIEGDSRLYRGSYPADWCSPYGGFRIVLAAQ